jgi:superoxide reductase
MASAEKFTQNDRIFEESAEKSKEAAIKHIPAITVTKKCGLIPEASCVDINVRIGAVLHPMELAHYIQFIDCYVDSTYVARVMLTPGIFAAGCFHLKTTGSKVVIIEKCTIHGYWKSDVNL